MTTHTERLAELGIELPDVVAPVAAYVPTARTGNLVFTSGQLPMVNGQLVATGKLGADVTLEQGAEAARACAVNALAALADAAGGLDNIVRVVKVVIFVSSAPEFTDQPKVGNGASELLGQVLADAGQHARSAVGVATLPLDAPVEVEVIAEVAPA